MRAPLSSFGIARLGAVAIAGLVLSNGPEDQRKQYEAEQPKTILELQQFRQSNSAPIMSRSGRAGVATLVNLNPVINTFYLLTIAWKDGAIEPAAHLENARAQDTHLILDGEYPSGIVVEQGHHRHPCELFGSGSRSEDALDRARTSTRAYVPLCEGRVYLRNRVEGRSTMLESAVDFLRDHVWEGEQVIDVFHHLLADRYRETGDRGARMTADTPTDGRTPQGRPLAALVEPRDADRRLIPRDMGIALKVEGPARNGMVPGGWYEGAVPGTWVSIIEPDVIAPSILHSYMTMVEPLDSVEASSLCYVLAFDLDQFGLAYATNRARFAA